MFLIACFALLALCNCGGGGSGAGGVLPERSRYAPPPVGATPTPAASPTVAPSGAPSATPSPAPSSAPTAQPTPAAGIPRHTQTFYDYGSFGRNTDIPAAFMAAHADIVYDDVDGDGPALLNAFKAAGGKYAMDYVQAAYPGHCTPAACNGQFGNIPEDGWFHDSSGARINYYVSSSFGYNDAVNYAAPSAQTALTNFTQAAVNAVPGLDFVYSDSSGGALTGNDQTCATGAYYHFNACGVEAATDGQWQNVEKGLFGASARPVIFNGYDVKTWKPAYNGMFLDLPNVAGGDYEGCFNNVDFGLYNTANGYWVRQSNGLLASAPHHKLIICTATGTGADPAIRIYQMASWWITYDPVYSVMAPVGRGSDGHSVFAEYDLVPTGGGSLPSDVSAFANGALYVRQFAACYQAGAPIGKCASVVNPTGSTVSLPATLTGYGKHLEVDSLSAYAGGKATLVTGVPGSLGPNTAAILSQ